MQGDVGGLATVVVGWNLGGIDEAAPCLLQTGSKGKKGGRVRVYQEG